MYNVSPPSSTLPGSMVVPHPAITGGSSTTMKYDQLTRTRAGTQLVCLHQTSGGSRITSLGLNNVNEECCMNSAHCSSDNKWHIHEIIIHLSAELCCFYYYYYYCAHWLRTPELGYGENHNYRLISPILSMLLYTDHFDDSVYVSIILRSTETCDKFILVIIIHYMSGVTTFLILLFPRSL